MRALLRTLLAVIGVLALVMVAAVVYVTTFFDPNDLKPRLVEVVREQSGLELELEGPLAWSFYPRLGLSVAEVEARLAEQGADEAPFAAFSKAEVSLAITPLISGDIAIDGLALDGMRLNLERDAEGRGNWEALLERLRRDGAGAESALSTASAAGLDPDDEAAMAVDLDIASVELRDGEIRYRDRQNALALRVGELSVTGSNVNPQSAFPLESSFQLSSYATPDGWKGDADPELVSDVSLDGRVKLGLDGGHYEVSDLALDTSTRMSGLGERQQKLNLRVEELVAELESRRYHLKGGKLDAGLSLPELGEKTLPLSLTFVADADLAEQTLQLREWQLTGEDSLKLSGSLNAKGLLEAPSYSGQVSLAPMPLRSWLKRLDRMPATADESALGEVALSSSLEGDLERLELPNLTLAVDDSTLTGSLAAGLDGRSLRFDLQGDSLDLDAYLPPPSAAPAAPDTAMLGLPGVDEARAQSSESADELLPVDWLAALTLDGRLSLEQLTAKGVVLEDLDFVVKGEPGQQRLERLAARLYDGSLAATGGLDLREQPVRWTLAPRLEQVDAAPLIEALSGEASPLRGRLNLDGELRTRGNATAALERNLQGRLATRIDKGAVLDVNVSEELCTAVAMLEGKQTSREWSEDTRFDRAQATFVIRDGVVHNDDLNVVIPGIEFSGEGELNLITRRFDYGAAARFVDTADAACEVNPRLERVPLPVRCEGQLGGAPGEWCGFDRDAFQSSIKELARQEATRRASEEVEEKLDEALEGLDERVGESASGELRDALRGLFK